MISYITGDIFTAKMTRQTLKAWDPFWDCVAILFEFQNSDIDDEHPEWRLHWVAGIALLRAIGHVLSKSDADISTAHKRAVREMWDSWKRDAEDNYIFWEFIESERNNILKTYTFGAKLEKRLDGFVVTYTDGEDALQLYREAVYWWRFQLVSLEKIIQERSGDI